MNVNNPEQFLVGEPLEKIDELISDAEIYHQSIRIFDSDKMFGDASYQPSRLNLVVEKGIVTQVYYG